MSLFELNLANSALEVKSSGCVDVSKDLEMPEGKSIAQLLTESTTNDKQEENS
jgi:hypothetical protein